MPVQSKLFAGRAKKPPPVPAPKPILKKTKADRSATKKITSRLVNGPVPFATVNNSPSVGFPAAGEVLRSPARRRSTSVDGYQGDDRRLERSTVGVEGMASELVDADVGVKGGSCNNVNTLVQRTPRLEIKGEQALKECEEDTDWANDILKRKKLPLISDLRKSVGDGFTLPTILEIISGATLHSVVSPQSKEDRVENLHHCLTFIKRKGCDVTDIDAKDLENGNLKASLLLVGKIKKHFDISFLHVNGHDSGHVDSSSTEPPAPPLPTRNTMPGAVKIPGAVPTPFTAARDPSPGRRNDISGSPPRKAGFRGDDIIPGLLNREPVSDGVNKPHSAIISNTELGTNGVSQHGVDERRQHMASNNVNSRGVVLRTSVGNKQATPPPLPDKGTPQGAPQAVTRAWTGGSPQAQHVQTNGPSTRVEDRLRQLIQSNSSKRTTTTANNNNNNGNNNNNNTVVDNKGYRSGFHGGGSEVFDDGELLVVPPPQTRYNPDFEMTMVGNNGYGPGYRHGPNQQRGQKSNQGYVPSKPSERWQGARADIMDVQPKRSPIIRARQHPASQAVPGMTGRDNHAFTPDGSPAALGSGKNTPNTDFTASKPPNSPHKSGGSDLRNAWNKLYGPTVQQTPNTAPDGPSNEASNGAPGPEIQRGNNLRSSHGPHPRQAVGHYSVKFAPSTPTTSTRPVSAPAPEHMQQVHFENQGQGHVSFEGHLQSQGHFHDQEHLNKIDRQGGQVNQNTSFQRESPMGQSSSTQGHLEGSTSSQMSGSSQAGHSGQTPVKSQFDGYGKSSLSSPSSPGSPNYAIGPAAKYPDMIGQPSSAKKSSGHVQVNSQHKQTNEKVHNVTDSRHSGSKNHNLSSDKNSTEVNISRQLHFSDELTTALQAANNTPSRSKHLSGYSAEDLDTESRDVQGRSIFDYDESHSESTSGSVTPPLPPLSPTNTSLASDSPRGNPSPKLGRSLSATNVSSVKDMLSGGQILGSGDRKPRRTSELQFKMERRSHSHKKSGSPRRGHRIRGASLNNVQENVSDSESNLSFDIDDTFLTVESHDTEQHPAGEVLTSHEAAALRQQLHDLESMYIDLQQKVSTDKEKERDSRETRGHGQGLGPPPIGRTRRWSIGSSDTSSFRRESKYKPGKQIHHRHHSREFKNVNKRFQRLESHVVTLARSVAHLSSELRTHNTMVNDLESIKKELSELKDNPGRAFPNVLGSQMTEVDRFRGWVPSLTNPKRVNKLTKFFGVEPPLLELFLKKLGYERYVTNFQSEHIGMIELPYMTEDRLEKIGVPMGPRLRILQEAQLCFRHENFNIYIV